MRRLLFIAAAMAALSGGTAAADSSQDRGRFEWITAKCAPFRSDGWAARHWTYTECARYQGVMWHRRQETLRNAAHWQRYSECVKARTHDQWLYSYAQARARLSVLRMGCPARHCGQAGTR